MKRPPTIIQIGKNGVTFGVIQLIKNNFTNRENVKIVLLKSAGHDRNNAQEAAKKIVNELGKNYTYKIVGFTIFLKKWRRDIR